ncbi:hypothetical protein I4U23_017080 [Adineta vaga]|nr:hypothetical protein I4U23_017080 [Adineta vaga]
MSSTLSSLLEPVAIIGMSCEFAGDIHCADDLWNALDESRDVGSAMPRDRLDIDSYCVHMFNMDNNQQFREKLVRRGYFLSNNQWDTFEASFFGLSDAEAGSMDPCHRLLMLKFVHLLDDAGYSIEKMHGSQTSVHIGQFSTDHAYTSLRMEPEYRSRFHGPNSLLYNAAARLSYHFNLQGPNVSLDVACSSSLEAVHMAVQTLRTKEANMAVCGGVNGVFAPESIFYSSTIGAQSPDGRSRSFSADANGYAKGEGLGLILLKRLSDAVRDGDRIYCVLRDVLSNHDGSEDKSNFVVPSAAGQIRLLTNIYKRTEFDPRRIFYVEAHGTGTPVGDPIEANCLGRFFNRSQLDPPLLIGSVKSNLGHTEGAAGIAGLIKVALCMHHRTIPPNMQSTSLNSRIEAQRYNLHVVRHSVPFPSSTNTDPIAIGINSFGMGGNNVHAIVEEYQPNVKNSFVNGCVIDHINGYHQIENKQYFVIIFSTKSRTSLNGQVKQFNQWLQKRPLPDDMNDDYAFLQRVSQQLLLKRTISYTHLAIFVFANRQELQKQINAFLSEQIILGLSIAMRPTVPLSKICFVFSGQGPQWWAMGRQLYESEPVFTRWIQLIDSEMSKINNGEWRLLDELIGKKTEQESRINDTNIAQPTLFAIQVALAALLVSWHIYPSSIISHSAGDQAAAFVAGRLTLEEAVRVVYHRSRLQNRNTRQGGRMLAVSMSKEEVQAKLLKSIEHLVCIAVVNSPRSVTLSGDEKTIDELERILSTFYPNVFKTRLRIENAFHCHQMDRFDIEKELLSSLKDIRGLPLKDPQQMFDPKCAQARLYSSVIGGELSDEMPVDAHYWWTNVRETVRFCDAMTSIAQNDDATIFLEISPHPVLATSIRECYESTNQQPLILPTLKRKENEQITLLTSLAQLITSSDMWKQYFHMRYILPSKEDAAFFDDFPLYTFNLTPCWYESKDAAIKRLANRIPTHPLLGVRQLTGQTNATWRSLININLPKYIFLKDHKIQDTILYPAVALLEMVTAGCRQLFLSSDNNKQSLIILEESKFVKPLLLSEHELTEVFTQIMKSTREWFIYSRPWSTVGPDCMRSLGMASTDFIDSFLDQQTLSEYSLNEFILHAHGRITIDSTQHKSTTVITTNKVHDQTWSAYDVSNVYSHLSTRGYQYGPSFQNMHFLQGTSTTVTAQISNALSKISDHSSYYLLHPSLLDACFHPLLALLPGANATFLPVGIQKFVSYTDNNNISHSNIEMRGNFHDSVYGLSQERTYTCDLMVLSNTDKNSLSADIMCKFEGLTVQRVQGVRSGRWTLEKSIFDKLNTAIELPNADHGEQLNIIIKDYCMKRTWLNLPIIKSIADLLPSPEQILENAINTITNHDLIESIEPFNELAACYAQMAIEGLDVNAIDRQYLLLFNTCQSLTSHISEQVTLHSTQLRLMNLFNRFPRLKPLLISMNNYGLHLKEVFSGQQSGIDVFLGNDETEQTLQQIKSIISANKTQRIFHAIGQQLQQQYDQICCESLTNRRLRIFWIASGEHLDALPVLHLLVNLSQQTSLWIDLHYMESDPVQLTHAEQLFQTHLADQTHLSITYDQTYDLFNSEILEKIPVESFDVVFAANELQGSQDLMKSLIDLRRLLIPNGLLLLLELIDVPLYFDLIFGLLDQWWSLSDNVRVLNNVHQWTTTLRELGGSTSIETILNQPESALIIFQKTTSHEILKTLDERKHQAWLFFAKNDLHSLGHTTASLLPCSNVRFFDMCNSKMEIIRSTIQMMMSKYKQLYVVFAWSYEQTCIDADNSDLVFKQHEESILGSFIQLLQLIQATSPNFRPFVFVITRHGQLNIESNCNIIASPLIGLTRSLMIEYDQHRLKLIDLQSSSSSLLDEETLAHALAQYLVTCRYSNTMDEVVLRLETNQNQSIKHLTWHYEMLEKQEENEEEKSKFQQQQQICINPQRDADQYPFRLLVPPSRFLNDLTWTSDKRVRELSPARGLYPHTRTFAQLDQDQPHVDRDTEPGSDFFGIIVRACSTTKFQPGNHVVGISDRGSLHSHIVLDSSQIVCIPPECLFTDEQLSVMPVVCLTVIYSLKYRVHLRAGQTVLIHAATGGAGQICIQYCQYIGARVIATAGSEEKRRFLRERLNVEYVFNSRDASFVNDVLTILPNGVDVVINSLSGPLLKQSIKLLASHGHFTALSLFDLRSDCSMHVIDLISLSDKQQDICTVMLQEMVDLFVQGKLKPIEPTVIYEPSQVIEACMRCNSGQAMGKSAVRLTNSNEPLNITHKSSTDHLSTDNDIMFPVEVCQQGTILISGGFGGLGLTMSRWMIEKRGVKYITLMSRRTLIELEQPSDPQYNEWLKLKQISKTYNAYVDVVQVDVTNFNQVHQLIENLNRTSHPVRGIIHTAVVAEDRSLANLTQEHLTRVLAAKVRGAWILHQVTQLTHAPIHFFIMFSSIRNHLLELAAASYNAGNQFLDALAHYRVTKLHIPALSVGLPAVSGAGMFHRHRDALISLQVTQGFELVPTTLYQRHQKLPTFHLRKIVEERYAAMNLTNALTTSSGVNITTDSNFNQKETIIERTQAAVSRLLGATNVDRILIDRSLVSQGMDSLAALSLYNWLGQETGIFIPLVDLLQGFSIETIATVIHKKLNERYEVVSSANKEQDMNIDIVKENDTISSNMSSMYTGTENIICLQRRHQHDSLVRFCIAEKSTTNKDESLFALFINDIDGQKTQKARASTYVIQIPSNLSATSISTCAREMIAQMRRIQPRGPYQLMTIRNKQEEVIAREMIRQLKDHFVINDVELLLMDG